MVAISTGIGVRSLIVNLSEASLRLVLIHSFSFPRFTISRSNNNLTASKEARKLKISWRFEVPPTDTRVRRSSTREGNVAVQAPNRLTEPMLDASPTTTQPALFLGQMAKFCSNILDRNVRRTKNKPPVTGESDMTTEMKHQAGRFSQE